MINSQELEISDNIAMDIEQLANGGFHPLKTFLNSKDLDSVLTNMRLGNGEIWPIPILFPKPECIKTQKNSTFFFDDEKKITDNAPNSTNENQR